MLYRFDDLHKSYGPHDILQGVTWQHNPGERVGLVGRKCAGKTTLFRLLLHKEDADKGTINRVSDLTIGHLEQHLDAPRSMSLFDFVLSAFEKVLDIERRMREIEEALSQHTDDHDRLEIDAAAVTVVRPGRRRKR